jgi:hypothetical protein
VAIATDDHAGLSRLATAVEPDLSRAVDDADMKIVIIVHQVTTIHWPIVLQTNEQYFH